MTNPIIPVRLSSETMPERLGYVGDGYSFRLAEYSNGELFYFDATGRGETVENAEFVLQIDASRQPEACFSLDVWDCGNRHEEHGAVARATLRLIERNGIRDAEAMRIVSELLHETGPAFTASYAEIQVPF